MTADAIIRARVDGQIKEDASVVLESMGLTISDAVRLLLTRIAREKQLPFEALIPNKETINAMKDARNGITRSFNSIDELMADLNADN